ncbi:hypothetical protein HanLR1_Chr03g0097351 [Helianthus annuus]|nr:hypothetical protein HanLR1_Chr08g0267891 [Helianthus annuus]KAJ0768087.1 hypothetical protein HanLR1_Chr03g0097351 [Helianthus annuus]
MYIGTLEVRGFVVYIIWFMKYWITLLMKPKLVLFQKSTLSYSQTGQCASLTMDVGWWV